MNVPRDPSEPAPEFTEITYRVGDQWQQAAVELVDRHPHGLKLKLVGVDDEDSARAWVGRELFIDNETDESANDEDGYTVGRLVGCQVVDDATGALVGTVQGVEEVRGGVDRWWIATPNGTLPIPAAKRYIRAVSLAERTVRVAELADLNTDSRADAPPATDIP